MEWFFKRKNPEPSQPVTNDISNENINVSGTSSTPTMPKLIDLKEISSDPCDRKSFLDYHPNQRDEIRRTYILRGPTRPKGYVYPTKMIGDKPRCFSPKWYEDFDWLEYSTKDDSLFCLPCYFLKDHI